MNYFKPILLIWMDWFFRGIDWFTEKLHWFCYILLGIIIGVLVTSRYINHSLESTTEAVNRLSTITMSHMNRALFIQDVYLTNYKRLRYAEVYFRMYSEINDLENPYLDTLITLD